MGGGLRAGVGTVRLMGRASRAKRERKVVAARESAAKARRAAEGEKRGCLFCRRGDGGFVSREHVVSESIGNDELVIPNGVVCDRCNNGVLSGLDETLGDFHMLKMARTIFGIPSKSGKVPTTRFFDGSTLSHDGSGVVLDDRSPKGMIRNYRESADGRVQFQISGKGGYRMTARNAARLARALLKIGLELAWIDHGEIILGDDYDHIRAAVLGEPFDGFIILDAHAPREQSVIEYFPVGDPVDALVVNANLHGIEMATASRVPPSLDMPEGEGIVFDFCASDLPRPKVVRTD